MAIVGDAPIGTGGFRSSIPSTPIALSTPDSGAILHITLQDAIERAKKLIPLNAALSHAKVAAETVVQAYAANLPNGSDNSQYLYTEGNGTPAARFIAKDRRTWMSLSVSTTRHRTSAY